MGPSRRAVGPSRRADGEGYFGTKRPGRRRRIAAAALVFALFVAQLRTLLRLGWDRLPGMLPKETADPRTVVAKEGAPAPVDHVVPSTQASKRSPTQTQGKVETAEIEIDVSVPLRTCQKKYILLSTQRSGSTWTCDLLQQQDGLSCGGRPGNLGHVSELLIQYSRLGRKIADVVWSTYKTDLDRAFAEACEHNPAGSIGFKLMYNQIPSQFLEDGNLEIYMRENGVSFVHLVREAKILKLASAHNLGQQETVMHHTKNATLAKRWSDTPKLPWDDKLIREMLDLENTSAEWQLKIHFMPLVPDYYLSYESLLNEEDRLHHIHQIIGFLTGTSKRATASALQTNGSLMQLHTPLCADRVENYEGFRTHDEVRGSRSAAACDMIQFHFGSNG